MPPKRKAERKLTGASTNRSRTNAAGGGGGSSNKASNDLPASAGYLISCDIPTKQYIQHLNDLKTQDKKFILEDLDAEHLLIKKKARAEIDSKVERWMDAVSEVALWITKQDFCLQQTISIAILIVKAIFLFSRMCSLLSNGLGRILTCHELKVDLLQSYVATARLQL